VDSGEPGEDERRDREVESRSPNADADREARARELERLLEAWMNDESGHDEEMWPRLKEVLEQDRLSYQRLFSETTQ
jgi:hypothetical protein